MTNWISRFATSVTQTDCKPFRWWTSIKGSCLKVPNYKQITDKSGSYGQRRRTQRIEAIDLPLATDVPVGTVIISATVVFISDSNGFKLFSTSYKYEILTSCLWAREQRIQSSLIFTTCFRWVRIVKRRLIRFSSWLKFENFTGATWWMTVIIRQQVPVLSIVFGF